VVRSFANEVPTISSRTAGENRGRTERSFLQVAITGVFLLENEKHDSDTIPTPPCSRTDVLVGEGDGFLLQEEGDRGWPTKVFP
jgi:hypothetical protein